MEAAGITYAEATLENLHRLVTADGAVDGNLLVTLDAKGAHSVARLGRHGLLARQLLNDLGGTGQLIAGLANADVDNQLLEPELLHGVLLLDSLAFLYRPRVAQDSAPGRIGNERQSPSACTVGNRRSARQHVKSKTTYRHLDGVFRVKGHRSAKSRG